MLRRSLLGGRRVCALTTALVIAIPARAARAQLALSVFGGTSFSLPTPLTISQSGFPDLHFTAQYRTMPFHETYYYAGRLALWGKHHNAWIFDYTHHKLVLSNPPPEVQAFRITFGFNQFAIGRAFYRHGLIWSLAAGPVLANPYSVIRGQLRDHSGGPWNSGYLLSGGTLQGGLSKQFRVFDRIFVVADSRVSLSYVRVPVANGHASVPNVALHLHFGVGFGGPRHWGADS